MDRFIRVICPFKIACTKQYPRHGWRTALGFWRGPQKDYLAMPSEKQPMEPLLFIWQKSLITTAICGSITKGNRLQSLRFHFCCWRYVSLRLLRSFANTFQDYRRPCGRASTGTVEL